MIWIEQQMSVQNRFNIYPDITLVGKAIGGGLPISLIIINRKILIELKNLKENFFRWYFSGNNFSLISCLNTLLCK